MHWIDWLLKEYKIKSRYELSKRTGLSQSMLSGMVKSNQTPHKTRFETMCSIADGLNITLDELRKKIDSFGSD